MLPATASYALIDPISTQVLFRTVPYDAQALLREAKRSGMYEQGGLLGKLALEDVILGGGKRILYFVEYAYDLKEKLTGVRRGQITDEIWFEAYEKWCVENPEIKRFAFA